MSIVSFYSTRRKSFKYLVALDQEIEIGVKHQCCLLIDRSLSRAEQRNISFEVQLKSENSEIGFSKRLAVTVDKQTVSCFSFRIDEDEIQSNYDQTHSFIATATFSAVSGDHLQARIKMIGIFKVY